MSDYEVEKDNLLAKLQSIRSACALGIDYRCQIIVDIKQDASKNEIEMQSMPVVGDLGLILKHIVTPSKATE